MNNLDYSRNNLFHGFTKKHLITKSKSNSYYRDVEIFMQWLASKVEPNAREVKKSGTLALPYDPFHPQKKPISTIDSALCFLYSLPTAFLSLNECIRVLNNKLT